MDVLQLIIYIFLIVIFTAVVWKGSFILETAAKKLSEYYRLPPVNVI